MNAREAEDLPAWKVLLAIALVIFALKGFERLRLELVARGFVFRSGRGP